MDPIVKIRNTTPLCFMPDGRLICYQQGNVVIINEKYEVKRFPLFCSKKERLLGKCKLINRFHRLGIRASVALDNNSIVLSIGNMLHELNIESCILSKGFILGNGIRPLIFSTVKDIYKIEDGIYFGGYLGNAKKKPVNVYHRTGVDQWKVVYTFPQGSINHVHNIVPDPYRNCLWMFTGDFDEASAIWKVTDNFQKVERVVCNDQKYRSCGVCIA